jgi:hypothetical protein
MTWFLVLVQFAKADFLERIRRYSFLVTLALTLVAAYLSVPPPDSKLVTVALGDIRGVYNSAWIGAMLAIMSACFLTMIGFYLVRNTLERDRKTRVDQILSSSPTSTFTYLLGKAISNFLILSCLTAVVIVTGIVMQFVRGEDTSLRIIPMVMPFLVMNLPTMAVIAALAVLFESLPVLRGSWGNVIYFFVWVFIIITSIDIASQAEHKVVRATNDMAGVSVLLHDMTEKVMTKFPDYDGDIQIGAALDDSTKTLRTFQWDGLVWTVPIILARLLWVAVALAMVFVASLGFRRFQGTGNGRMRKQGESASQSEALSPGRSWMDPTRLLSWDWSPRSSFVGIVLGEIRLTLSSAGRLWYLVALGLLTAQLVAPLEVVRQFIVPAAWIWPLALWSAMGCRERMFGTDQVVYSAPNMIQRQVAALWLAGIALTLFTGFGLGLRFLMAGDLGGFASWGSGVIFIPALALVCGVITGGRKLFEVLYIFLWYVGPLNKVPQLDYIGVTSRSAEIGIPICFAVLAIGFMILAQVWRGRTATS